MIGRLGRPHGLDGHLGLYLDESDVEYFESGNTVLVDGEPFVVTSIRRADRGFHVRFKGITSRVSAETIRGAEIAVIERRPLADDEYWPDDLIGLEVRVTESATVGVVDAVITGAAQDRLSVTIGDDQYEIPLVAELVPVVDISNGYIEMAPIPGLIEPPT